MSLSHHLIYVVKYYCSRFPTNCDCDYGSKIYSWMCVTILAFRVCSTYPGLLFFISLSQSWTIISVIERPNLKFLHNNNIDIIIISYKKTIRRLSSLCRSLLLSIFFAPYLVQVLPLLISLTLFHDMVINISNNNVNNHNYHNILLLLTHLYYYTYTCLCQLLENINLKMM